MMTQISLFILNYHPMMLISVLLLTTLYKFYNTYFRTNYTTDQDDATLLALWACKEARRNGRMLPLAAYREWSRNTIKG